MVTDPVADFIVRILNAGRVQKSTVSIPYSKFKHAIADKLQSEGYLLSVEKNGKKVQKTLDITLSYKGGKHAITGMKRMSTPGQRLYEGVKDIRAVKQGYGAVILSTPKGVLTGREARQEKVGGEVLLKIW